MAEEEPVDIIEDTLEDIGDFDEIPDERIMEAYEENRSSLVEFYKGLVELGEGEIPKKMLKEAGKSERMEAAEDLLYRKLELLREGSIADPEERMLLMYRLCLAHFLLDRSMKLEELTVKTGNVSLYCLYLSLEERVCDMLSERYYESSFEEMMDEYLETEPILAACSDLCGLVVPPMEEILEQTQKDWLEQQLALP